jgi:hypothetical protein
MFGKTFFRLTFFAFVLLPCFVHGKAEIKTENGLEEIIEKLLKEVSILKEEVKQLLNAKDVESDIEDIKRTLESHGDDLTSLRINQGRIEDDISQLGIDLTDVNTVLASNAEKFASHDQTFVQHQAYMAENRGLIDGHTQIVNDHQGYIQVNIEGIANNANRIQENANGIAKNVQDIQAVSDTFINYRNSQVKFYVETPCCEGTEYNPEWARLTYPKRYLDTHNAVSDSQFTAPIGGVYGFIFTADFRLYDERAWQGYIHVNINEGEVKKYMFDSRNDDEIWQAYSIFFSLILNPGDRVDITTSGEPCFDVSRNSASLMGYLMQ